MIELLKLYELAEESGITVDCFRLNRRAALSYMDAAGTCSIAIDPMRLQSERDERLKLAHEMGHCKTGSFYNPFSTLDVRRKHETKADKWAIQKLVPKQEFVRAVESGATRVWELAEAFGVTEEMIEKAALYYAPLDGKGQKSGQED